eukprot:Gb_29848 [translate_table: standard]
MASSRQSRGPVKATKLGFREPYSPANHSFFSSSSVLHYSVQRSHSPNRVNGCASSSAINLALERSASLQTRAQAAPLSPKGTVPRNHIPRSVPPKPRTCMCSPTTHPGSFRCSLHRNVSLSRPPQSRLHAKRSAMTNSLVRICTVEGESVKRALSAVIRPSSHQARRSAIFPYDDSQMHSRCHRRKWYLARSSPHRWKLLFTHNLVCKLIVVLSSSSPSKEEVTFLFKNYLWGGFSEWRALPTVKWIVYYFDKEVDVLKPTNLNPGCKEVDEGPRVRPLLLAFQRSGDVKWRKDTHESIKVRGLGDWVLQVVGRKSKVEGPISLAWHKRRGKCKTLKRQGSTIIILTTSMYSGSVEEIHIQKPKGKEGNDEVERPRESLRKGVIGERRRHWCRYIDCKATSRREGRWRKVGEENL